MMASETHYESPSDTHYESTPNLELTYHILFRNSGRVDYTHAASIIDAALGYMSYGLYLFRCTPGCATPCQSVATR